MRHKRCCHAFKGFIGKCEGCGENFTTNKIIWNAVKLWCSQNNDNSIHHYFGNDIEFPFSKKKTDIVSLRFLYDMEYFSRYPKESLKKRLVTIVLNQFNKHE
jgi:hypothetical protein